MSSFVPVVPRLPSHIYSTHAIKNLQCPPPPGYQTKATDTLYPFSVGWLAIALSVCISLHHGELVTAKASIFEAHGQQKSGNGDRKSENCRDRK